jgi:uncharacterized membrane protein YccF (DUF307 family)
MSQQPPIGPPPGQQSYPVQPYQPPAQHPPMPTPISMPPQYQARFQPEPYQHPGQIQPYQQPYYPQTQLFITPPKSPNLFLRFLWFIFIGWWLSAFWMGVAWLFIVLIVTMPLGLVMVNKLPFLVSLKQASVDYQVAVQGGITRIRQVEKQQASMLLRVFYFLLIGWWLSGLWMLLAWFLGLTIIGLPLTIMMYDRVPAVTTLRRY